MSACIHEGCVEKRQLLGNKVPNKHFSIRSADNEAEREAKSERKYFGRRFARVRLRKSRAQARAHACLLLRIHSSFHANAELAPRK